MINAIRLSRNPPPRVFSTHIPPHIRRSSAPKLAITLATAPESGHNMDDAHKTNEPTGRNREAPFNVMSDSFGDGYATRSDEEGFGGVYGGNQSAGKTNDNECSGEQRSAGLGEEYDKSQGCEVKEKEKARHQTHANG